MGSLPADAGARNARQCAGHHRGLYIRLFESELVRRLTDRTTIGLKALVAGKPMSLYFVVPPHRMQAYVPPAVSETPH